MSDFSLESFVLAFKEANISKAELAKRMKVSPQAVNNYFKSTPSLDTWNKFFKAIGKPELKSYFNDFENIDTAPQVNEAEYQYQARQPEPVEGPHDLVSKLKELSNLYQADLLTKEEFADAKAIIIKKFKDK